MKVINIIALILVIIGAINWGLVGFFDFDLVAWIFGVATTASKVIYSIVGIAGLWSLSFFRYFCCCSKDQETPPGSSCCR